MKNMMLFYRLIIISLILSSLVQNATLKPINKKNNIVKITDENKNTRTYYHLEKNNEMVFSNLEEFVDDPTAAYSIKVITRAKISPNSNSSRTFGIDLSILEEGVERNKKLEYKKGASTAKKSSKSGFNFTQAGFWFDELRELKGSEILITLMDGSPPVDIRVLINKINYRTSDQILYPVNKEKSHKVLYKNEPSDLEYKSSKGWYYLDPGNDLQYKIKGPKQVRILTRSVIDGDSKPGIYNFLLRENGRYINDYMFQAEVSNQDAHFLNESNKLSVGSYNSFFFNVPEGVNYYSLRASNDQENILVKIQSYQNKEK